MNVAFDMGMLALQRGAYQGAVDHFQGVLGQDPENAMAHAMISIALSNLGRRYAALVEARRALELEPERPEAHVAAAYAHALHHDYRAAEKSFGEALAIDPQNHAALLGRCQIAKARNDTKMLERALDDYRSVNPDDPECLILAAHLMVMQGDLDGAEQAARAALEADPEDADAFTALGLVHARKGDAHKARHMALTALNIAPEDRDAHRLLAQAKMQERPIIGYWQRFSLWLSLGGGLRIIGVLIGLWLAYRVGVALLDNAGYSKASGLLQIAWLAFVAMTWVAGFQYRRLVERDLEKAQLDPNY